MERFRWRILELNTGDLWPGDKRGGMEESLSTKHRDLFDPPPISLLGETLTGVSRSWGRLKEGELSAGLRAAGDCSNWTDTLLGVLTGVLKVSVDGDFKIDFAFTPDFGVGGWGLVLK